MAVFPLLQPIAELWRNKRGEFERLTRPVSLTSILVKSLERIIHKHIKKFLTHHRLLSDSHSFMCRSMGCLFQLDMHKQKKGKKV